eukprot:5874814-Amphidinium_carterae.1
MAFGSTACDSLASGMDARGISAMAFGSTACDSILDLAWMRVASLQWHLVPLLANPLSLATCSC